MIEIGRDRSYKPTGGGKGTIVIDIVPEENITPTGKINLGVEVGSAEKGTVKIMGTDFIEIPIILSN
ncbi:MAG: DUF648 domain-containing protein [Candidatus Pristimantibacillus lignocellulolyticus]|uniref:DUF648 domain-containing protein n=1 Tax=Candidatus Pristimantibacillus lignocellulolyticus TaxID=2994561 RepID=A0A9J6ZCL1_9BACL|nr:MAG: DUF648 domain-containing protein [Candidatus Pristimantibacillus lignocellulolyticus]